MNNIHAKPCLQTSFLDKYKKELDSIGFLSRLAIIGSAITILVYYLKPNYFGYPFFKGFNLWDLAAFWPLVAFCGVLTLASANKETKLDKPFLSTVLFSSIETSLDEFGLRLAYVIPIMVLISMANWVWMSGGALLVAFVLAVQFPAIISGSSKSENLKEFGKYFLVFLICAIGVYASIDSYIKQSGPIIEFGNWLSAKVDLPGAGDHKVLFFFTLVLVSGFLWTDEEKYSGNWAQLSKVVMVFTLTVAFLDYGFFFALTLRLLCNFEYYALRFATKR